MTNEVVRHYESLLAPNYTWMFGIPFEAKVLEQQRLLEHLLGSEPPYSGLAVDLGSGPGFQAIALAELGCSPVIAIDTSETLLKELEQNRGGRAVTAIHGDLRETKRHVQPHRARVIVCMGDTLTHLPDHASVRQLFTDVYESLEPGGSFVLTFRDLSIRLDGLDRFIPVRSDADRILTCFLEFGTDFVTVHDLLYLREENGENGGWQLKKSSYRKLLLSVGDVTDALSDAGFSIAVNEPSGRLHAIVAKR
jgi:SAM-dependent methyltransferase